MFARHLHFIWIQGEEHLRNTRPDLYEFVQSWPPSFPSWTMRVWDDASILEALQQIGNNVYVEAYKRARKNAMKADIARYAIVYLHGGMYVDTDMECLRSFQHMLVPDKPTMMYLHELTDAEQLIFKLRVNNFWFFAPQPGFQGFTDLLTHGCTRIMTSKPKELSSLANILSTTGPEALHKVMYGPHRYDINWISEALLNPINITNMHLWTKDMKGDVARKKFPYGFALHHYDNSYVNAPKALVRGVMTMHGRVRENYMLIVTLLFVFIIVLIGLVLFFALRKKSSLSSTYK